MEYTPCSGGYYSYEPLQDASRHVRILRLRAQHVILGDLPGVPQCSLEEVVLTEAHEAQYTALSYAWVTTRDTRPILLNDKRKEVTKNLWLFLCQAARDLRDSEKNSAAYWIDALCINQDDTQEKSAQVSIMGTIYTLASNVNIWLGPAIESTQLAMDFLKYLASHQSSLNPSGYGHTLASGPSLVKQASIASSLALRMRHILKHETETLVPLRALLDASWWRRCWVQQEMALSSIGDTTLSCGMHSMAWRDVVAAHDCLTSLLLHIRESKWDQYHKRGPEIKEAISWCHSRMLQTCRSSYHQVFGETLNFNGQTGRDSSAYRSNWKPSPTLADRLLVNATATPMHRTDATQLVDYVYSIIGISSDAKDENLMHCQPDYNVPVRTLYISVAVYMLATIGAETFGICGGTSDRLSSEGVVLPSWVPDLSTPVVREPLGQKGLVGEGFRAKFRKLGRDSLSGTATQEYHLELKAIKLDVVVEGPSFHIAHDSEADSTARSESIALAWLAAYKAFINALSKTKQDICVDDWWRVPVCDHRPDAEWRHASKKWRKCFEGIINDPAGCANAKLDSNTTDYLSRVSEIAINRVPFLTEEGRVGLGPPTQVNDKIYLPIGGVVPLVVRPTGTGRYTLVGEAYISGFRGNDSRKDAEVDTITIA